MGFFSTPKKRKNTLARVKSQIKKAEKALELKAAKAKLASLKNKI